MQRTRTIKLIRTSLIVVFIALIAAYAVWGSLDYMRGPQLTTSSPTDGMATSSQMIYIGGHAERISSITLNGRAISTNESGYFNEPVVIFKGMNIETIEARDQFGRSIRKEIRVVGME